MKEVKYCYPMISRLINVPGTYLYQLKWFLDAQPRLLDHLIDFNVGKEMSTRRFLLELDKQLVNEGNDTVFDMLKYLEDAN